MNNSRMAILASLILVFSSVAGCLEDESVEEVEDLIEDVIDDSMDENNTAVETGQQRITGPQRCRFSEMSWFRLIT